MWLGFEQSTPHQATQSQVDQSAFDLTESEARETAAPEDVPAEAAPVETSVAEADPIDAAEHETPETTRDMSESEVAPIADATLIEAVRGAMPDVRDMLEALLRLASGVTVANAEPVRSSAEPTPSARSVEPDRPRAEGQQAPGAGADRDSDATSTQLPLEVKPGQTLAAEGMEILTVRPQWLVVTRMTTAPRNPLVVIDFGRDGRVVHAEYVARQTTGYPGVDGPLLDAIYQWRARGKRIENLRSAPAEDVVRVSIRILLR